MRFTHVNGLRAELAEEELRQAALQVEKCTERMDSEEKRAFAEGIELANIAWVQAALTGALDPKTARVLSALYVAAYDAI